MITSSVVERAFRTVPRHLFVPEDTPLDVAYNADKSVATKSDGPRGFWTAIYLGGYFTLLLLVQEREFDDLT